MRKKYYALICVAIALLLLFGCSPEQIADKKIKKWEKKASGTDFDVWFFLQGKKLEKLSDAWREAIILGGGKGSWGILEINLKQFVISDDKVKKITIEDIRDKDPKVLEALIKKIRTDFINLIESLGLESDIKYKYMDFNTQLVWMKGLKSLTIMEIDERGRFTNRMYLLHGVTEEELERAKKNYKKERLFPYEDRNRNYVYGWQFNNENEKISLYVYNCSLVGKKYRTSNFEKLTKGRDYEVMIESEGLVAPKAIRTFYFKVDRHIRNWHSLDCQFEVGIH